MRKFIILAISLMALAVPAAGIASVAVDANGTGFVGKGDVQTALGYGNGNDKAFQADHPETATFTITSDVTTQWAYGVLCGTPDANGIVALADTYSVDVNMGTYGGTVTTITANPKITGGKVSGYNLTGSTETTQTTVDWSLWSKSCKPGDRFAGWADASNVFRQVTTPGHGLQVTLHGKTADLPNTPVEIPAV